MTAHGAEWASAMRSGFFVFIIAGLAFMAVFLWGEALRRARARAEEQEALAEVVQIDQAPSTSSGARLANHEDATEIPVHALWIGDRVIDPHTYPHKPGEDASVLTVIGVEKHGSRTMRLHFEETTTETVMDRNALVRVVGYVPPPDEAV